MGRHARRYTAPRRVDEGLKMKGPGGLETALLLVRRTPLPPSVDLAASIGPLPPSPLRNELEVAKRGFDEGQPIEALRWPSTGASTKRDREDRRPAPATDGAAEDAEPV